MGVLRWPPQVVREAALPDLHDAFRGYAEHNGLLPALPAVTKDFMQEMLARFPDAKGMTG